MACVYNNIARGRYVPESTVKTLTVPQLKPNRDADKLKSCGGISIIQVIAKILERLLKDTVVDKLPTHSLQFEYKKNWDGVCNNVYN